MAASIALSFDSMPSMTRFYLGSLRPRPRGGAMPSFEASIANVTTLTSEVARYRELVGFRQSALLPPTWPQVLAGPLHAAIVCHPKFPFPAMGLVHVRNVIRTTRPLFENLPLDLRTWVDNVREVPRGHEFDLHTTAAFRGEPVWSSTTTVLSMSGRKSGASSSGGARPAAAEAAQGGGTVVQLRLASNLGRQYSALAGDWNPIHFSAVTARPFGFRKAIIHGMWTFARAVAELDIEPMASNLTYTVDFRRPVPLPSTIAVGKRTEGDTILWQVTDPDSGRVLVDGSVAPNA
jgi:hypothetical protein